MIKLTSVLNEVIKEGVYDPGILKAVFLAGGPGSGKTSTANQLLGISFNSFSVDGLKPVNSDKFFEFLLKSRGKSANLAAMSPEERAKITTGPDSEREIGKSMMKTSYTYYINGRLGIIIDGTGDEPQKTRKQAEELQQVFGYDVAMVFVNTSLEKAIDRQKYRDRKLPAELITKVWNEAQKAKEVHKAFFGANFIEVINEEDSASGQVNIEPQVQKAVQAFVKKSVQNPIGKEWIKKALAAKSSMNEAEQSQYEIFCDMDGVLCDFVRQWNKIYKEDPNTTRHRIGKPEFDVILDAADRQFWNTMKWMPGSDRMWKLISRYGAKILSSPADSTASTDGKTDWVKQQMPGTELIFRKSFKKQEFSGPNKILIDDLKRNIDQWTAKGGIGIHFINAQQAIRDLEKLGIK